MIMQHQFFQIVLFTSRFKHKEYNLSIFVL
jgi:hypothetical protein